MAKGIKRYTLCTYVYYTYVVYDDNGEIMLSLPSRQTFFYVPLTSKGLVGGRGKITMGLYNGSTLDRTDIKKGSHKNGLPTPRHLSSVLYLAVFDFLKQKSWPIEVC